MADSDAPNPGSNPIVSEALTPGEKFGDYQVMQCISMGLIGGLYRLQSIRTFEEVCAYVLPKAATEVPAFSSTGLVDLVERLKLARHTRLLNPEKAEVINGCPSLIMEKIEAVNMADYLETYVRQKREEAGEEASGTTNPFAKTDESQLFGLPSGVVKDVAKQAAESIRELHNRGVRHLNLSPQNMLITVEGDIRVAGHGLLENVDAAFIQRLLAGGVRVTKQSTTLAPFATREQIAPELQDGNDPVDATDFYSLGASIFFLLTGKRPTPVNLENEAAFKTPSSFSSAIPMGWDKIVRKCLDPRHEERYKDADALIKDIEDVEKISLQMAKKAEAGTRAPMGADGEVAAGNALERQLQKVPVPKQVRDKVSGKTLRLIRMGILGVFGLLVVGIGGYSYTALMSEEATEGGGGSRIARVAEGEPANLVLSIQPPAAQVLFSGTERGKQTITTGKLHLRMPVGVYNIEVKAPDHKDTTLKAIDVTSQKEEYTIRLKPNYGTLKLTTKPAARVIVGRDPSNPVDLGIADESGLLETAEIFEGIYTVQVTLEDFQPFTVEGVEIKEGKVTELSADPLPMPAKAIISSQPTGATISINGRPIGKTPATISDLPAGDEITFELIKDSYRTVSKTVTFKPATEVELDFGELEPKAGAIQLLLTFAGQSATPELLKDTRVLFEEESLPADQTEIGPVPEGNRKISIEHPDYMPFSQEVLVGDRQVTKVEAVLKPRPGVLTLKFPKPIAYRLSVNGRAVESASDSFEFPAGQEFELVLAPQDHLLIKRTISFTANEKVDWDVAMVPIPGPEIQTPYTIPYVGIEMAWLSAGTYKMGSPLREEARLAEDGPPTSVTITKGFWMGKYEVTQAQFIAIMRENPSLFAGRTNLSRPVERVSYREAVEYCQRLTEREREAGRMPKGYEFRLPTEAEWEYACRAGSSTPFHWGDTADPRMANIKGVFPRELEGVEEYEGIPSFNNTVDVGQYQPNAFGLYDMHGNVSEWCLDTWRSRLSGNSETDPVRRDERVEERVIRGGGWEDFAKRCRSGSRRAFEEKTKSQSIGFRIVCAPVLK